MWAASVGSVIYEIVVYEIVVYEIVAWGSLADVALPNEAGLALR